jgi:RimJ/RimL family protein N-acetyltransferase
VIETARLILRAPLPEDLAWQVEHLNTATVMRHLGGMRQLADVSAGFEINAAAMARGEPAFWTVVLRSGGAVLGKCGLSPIESGTAPAELRGGVQIGWTFAEAWWGQGLASEAARAVIDHAFAGGALAELWSQTSESNAASSRMMARLGLQRCAVLDYVDPDYPATDNPTTVYRIGRDAWAGGPAKE